MVKLSQSPGLSGPSSSLGVMRFFDVDARGPKISPQLVLGIAVAFTLLVLLAKNFF